VARCPGQVEASRALLLGAVNCEQLKSARVYDWTWLHGCMETSVILTRQIDLSTGSKISSPAREFLKKPSPVCPRFTLQDSQGFATEQTGFNSSQGLEPWTDPFAVCVLRLQKFREARGVLSLSRSARSGKSLPRCKQNALKSFRCRFRMRRVFPPRSRRGNVQGGAYAVLS
jgi:hypothetical protein